MVWHIWKSNFCVKCCDVVCRTLSSSSMGHVQLGDTRLSKTIRDHMFIALHHMKCAAETTLYRKSLARRALHDRGRIRPPVPESDVLPLRFNFISLNGRCTGGSCFTVCGVRRLSHKNLKMHP